jgi:hypothetical protein
VSTEPYEMALDISRIDSYLKALLAAGINVPNEVSAASDRLMRGRMKMAVALDRADRINDRIIAEVELAEHLEQVLPDSKGG